MLDATTRRRPTRPIGGTRAVALVAVVLAACGADDASHAPTLAVGYVGSSACAGCHADVARAWDASTHRLAMLPATQALALAAPDAAGDPLVRRGDALAATAAGLGHDRDVDVAWVLGRKHVEQPLGTFPAGRMQALPRAFDVERRDWFDLFAGDPRTPADWGHWTNRGMTANAQCLFCHTTAYDKGYAPAGDAYATKWGETGVGCEACHGPGAEHMRARRGGATDPWVGRDPERLLDACEACHTRRVERADFTPGDDLLDAFDPEVLDTDAYHPDGQVKEELYEGISFRTSRMYREGVRCWNCHEPHASGTKAPGNALCRTCHDVSYDTPAHTHHAAGTTGADCRGCHMPITVYMQRDPRHDHSFARPDPDATVALGVPNACTRCHADRDAAWAAEHVHEWFPDDRQRALRRAVTRTIAAARDDDPAAAPALVELSATGADAVRRASAARLLARFPTASGATSALVHALDDGDALVRAGAAWALGQRAHVEPEARAALVARLDDPRRVVRQHAAFALRDVPDGELGAAAERFARAADEWRAGQRRLTDTPEAHYNLAVFDTARGSTADAEAEYRAALRLWPRSYRVRHNLGMLLAGAGRLDEAATEFETVLADDPVPDSAFALGLLRAQQGRWRDAVAALERCVAEDPAYPRARYNLALAYAKSGDSTKALDELERAAALEDTHREAVLALIDLARQVHDKPRLERWVVEAAKLDPDVAANPDLRDLLGR
jgi:predicted CXXCH cytochrome family protein